MKNNHLKILLAAPRGFCAGVDRAIEIVKKSIDKYGAPVYVRHEIVHNKHVVDNLKKIGAIFVEEIDEIEDKTRPVIFSAHGVPKSVPKEASNLNMIFVDATCPLVSKVHRDAEMLSNDINLTKDSKGHSLTLTYNLSIIILDYFINLLLTDTFYFCFLKYSTHYMCLICELN